MGGYFAGNDISEREWLLERGPFTQWINGKSPDTFGPIGPWLVTPDEVGNPQKLHMWLDVNGKRFQDNNTSDMIYNCATLVSFMSKMITLYPGDIIFTGTPQGVGLGLGDWILNRWLEKCRPPGAGAQSVGERFILEMPRQKLNSPPTHTS